ncbi:MAG: UBP-type zinc finger domain-containing protein [Nitrososphaeraceae archaeon]
MKQEENNQSCVHLDKANQKIDPNTPEGCEECLQTGSSWVHLRLCLTCGHVGCCDNSINMHGTKHFHSTRHPVIRSYEPGENWKWCFVDEIFRE